MASENGEEYTREPLRTGCGIGVVFGALVGGVSAGMLFTTSVNFKANLDSTDFMSAVLSALGALMGLVSVLLAIVALAIAVAAFFGWHEIKRRTDEIAGLAATKAAVPAAQQAAVQAAVPEAIDKVDEYLARISPQIELQVAAIVTRTITPELVKVIEKNQREMSPLDTDAVNISADGFTEDVVERAAKQEADRQEQTLEAFDAAFEVDETRAAGDPADNADRGA